eukprot:2983356-Prymnesium_polylepis.1
MSENRLWSGLVLEDVGRTDGRTDGVLNRHEAFPIRREAGVQIRQVESKHVRAEAAARRGGGVPAARSPHGGHSASE